MRVDALNEQTLTTGSPSIDGFKDYALGRGEVVERKAVASACWQCLTRGLLSKLNQRTTRTTRQVPSSNSCALALRSGLLRCHLDSPRLHFGPLAQVEIEDAVPVNCADVVWIDSLRQAKPPLIVERLIGLDVRRAFNPVGTVCRDRELAVIHVNGDIVCDNACQLGDKKEFDVVFIDIDSRRDHRSRNYALWNRWFTTRNVCSLVHIHSPIARVLVSYLARDLDAPWFSLSCLSQTNRQNAVSQRGSSTFGVNSRW